MPGPLGYIVTCKIEFYMDCNWDFPSSTGCIREKTCLEMMACVVIRPDMGSYISPSPLLVS
jgi:hypothetical protein